MNNMKNRHLLKVNNRKKYYEELKETEALKYKIKLLKATTPPQMTVREFLIALTLVIFTFILIVVLVGC